MKKKSAAAVPVEQRAEGVLSGRVEVDAEDLAALIREINPTDRRLDKYTQAARYQLKSRLQSELLRSYPSRVKVVPSPEFGDGVVLLKLPGLGTAASHAVLAELDEDARAYARRALDEAIYGVPSVLPLPPPPRASQTVKHTEGARGAARTPSQMLADGRQHQLRYEYEQAQQCFEEAIMAGAVPEAARELLALLVDTLALDTDAIAVTHALDARTRKDPTVRILFGIALTRTGEADRAFDEVVGITVPQAARVFAAVAFIWLNEGRIDEAIQLIETVRRCDASSPELPALSIALRCARGAAR